MFTKLSILIALVAWAVTLAVAFDDDPPGRAARLSLVNGAVSLQPGGVEDWVVAELNRWADDGARAEVPIGSAARRLDGHTNSVLINFDDRTAQVEVAVGTVNIRLRELDTPHVERVRISGSAQQPQPGEAPPADTFDNCCVDRGQREERSVSAGYVSRDVPGYQDLDDRGVWRDVPGYDEMWTSSPSPRMTFLRTGN